MIGYDFESHQPIKSKKMPFQHFTFCHFKWGMLKQFFTSYDHIDTDISQNTVNEYQHSYLPHQRLSVDKVGADTVSKKTRLR